MKHNLNDRFILSSDHYNWILTDKNRCKNNQKSYFPNLKQLSKFIVEIKAKDFLAKCAISLCSNSATSRPYNSVINEIEKDVEVYFRKITNNERG
jgi:hypothetical protein